MVDVDEVAENIYMIDDQLYSIPRSGSVYFLNEEKKALVDTGPTTSAKVVLDGIRQIGFSPGDVAYIIITHIHLDHGGGAGTLLKEMPQENWLEVENFSFFDLDGTKIWAVIDCSFKTEDGATIIDWKTGRSTVSDVSLQLSCYAMYGKEKWGMRPEKIKLIEYNLLSDQKMESSVTEGEIANTRAYIKGSIADMQSLLVDVENNVAKEEDSFKKVEDNWVRNRCNFRKVCDLS